MSLKDMPTTTQTAEIQETSRSPKSGRYNIALLVLCLVGVGIAGYLTYTHVFNQPIVCASTGCDIVNSSQYASFLGIPVAILGFGAYATLTLLVIGRWIAASRANLLWRNRLDWVLFIFSLSALIFSAYLVSMSLFVIKATCLWCLGSATIISLLFILLTIRLWRSLGEV